MVSSPCMTNKQPIFQVFSFWVNFSLAASFGLPSEGLLISPLRCCEEERTFVHFRWTFSLLMFRVYAQAKVLTKTFPVKLILGAYHTAPESMQYTHKLFGLRLAFPSRNCKFTSQEVV